MIRTILYIILFLLVLFLGWIANDWVKDLVGDNTFLGKLFQGNFFDWLFNNTSSSPDPIIPNQSGGGFNSSGGSSW